MWWQEVEVRLFHVLLVDVLTWGENENVWGTECCENAVVDVALACACCEFKVHPWARMLQVVGAIGDGGGLVVACLPDAFRLVVLWVRNGFVWPRSHIRFPSLEQGCLPQLTFAFFLLLDVVQSVGLKVVRWHHLGLNVFGEHFVAYDGSGDVSYTLNALV